MLQQHLSDLGSLGRRCMVLLVISAALLQIPATQAQNAQPELPRQMAWTAYNLGTTGYNQSVAIGAMLRDEYNITLRVIPGQNDVSRLLPLKNGRVEFSANGVATYFAQEGVYQFGDQQWGPQALRMLITSNGLSNQAVAVAADVGVSSFAELRGRRVPFVRAAPALNISMEAYLACGGLGWDDVVRVDFPGYDAMWEGLINGDVDVAFGTTVSGPTRRLEASPRGIAWLPAPHDDEACWANLLSVAPYFTRHMATRGPGISDENPQEAGTYPYPMLITQDSQDENTVYWMTRVIHENYDAYKDADPGAIGWALDRQVFDWVVPYHEGAVRYWREIGAWTDALDAHNNELIRRQSVLAAAWQEATSERIRDRDEFQRNWQQVRSRHLREAGFNPVWETWD
ncbi:TAXI family TRAP transporter solute-binding subunit [Pseudohongiella spirulinae]|uniref:Putative TrapT family, dctP subunit, C4-dicarboxylate periplasmic binding protein n=1 Tax=Pseudohongiella spirulinae TaxID=1249552 RepID=A0A0S2KFY3_9GAMM|nr:TAXI family TRAP transporter solute-binding subunit [Pseudohongiella spirulinae]ALO47248.1 putative TrapT family, dctP subunit, C4-dicarboxylate periplasmic binding protein [Pseudohongiella spirulinae]